MGSAKGRAGRAQSGPHRCRRSSRHPLGALQSTSSSTIIQPTQSSPLSSQHYPAIMTRPALPLHLPQQTLPLVPLACLPVVSGLPSAQLMSCSHRSSSRCPRTKSMACVEQGAGQGGAEVSSPARARARWPAGGSTRGTGRLGWRGHGCE